MNVFDVFCHIPVSRAPACVPLRALLRFIDTREELSRGYLVIPPLEDIIDDSATTQTMQAATQQTLANLVEAHVTALVRESAAVNRHSRRGGLLSAGDEL